MVIGATRWWGLGLVVRITVVIVAVVAVVVVGEVVTGMVRGLHGSTTTAPRSCNIVVVVAVRSTSFQAVVRRMMDAHESAGGIY